jgi:cation diffusion facilitator family transporter
LPPTEDRSTAITQVLLRVLVLNLAVAVAKILLGVATGAISVLSDGFHSLTDTASNVVALVGVRLASRPPDEDHPYGHRKFETMASVGILVFLLLVMVQVLWAAGERVVSGGEPRIGPLSFLIMACTFLVNVAVVSYERRAARRLRSEVLLADAHHTRSDLLTSATVIVALIGVTLGFPWLDPVAAVVVAGFIAYACWQIFNETSRILADRVVLAEQAIEQEVRSVPGVIGCHHIRTRGTADHVFLDLHVWVAGDMPLREAHGLSHDVKDRLMARFPEIKDAVIHIEPPPPPRSTEAHGKHGNTLVD